MPNMPARKASLMEDHTPEVVSSPAFRPQASDADPLRDAKRFRLKAGLRTALPFFSGSLYMSQFWDRSFPQTNTFRRLRFTPNGINGRLPVCCGRADSGAAIA